MGWDVRPVVGVEFGGVRPAFWVRVSGHLDPRPSYTSRKKQHAIMI